MTTLKADGRATEPLYAYAAELRRLGLSRFEELYGRTFLLLDTAALRGRHDLAATTLEPLPEHAEVTAPTSFEVLALRSRTDANTITLGRSEECDVVISDQSISSTHAVFMRSSTGALSLRDSASKNGTFVDERFVSAGAEGYTLGGRHSLRFGSLSAIFLDLEALAKMAKLFDP